MRNFLTHFPWLTGSPEVLRVEPDKYGFTLTLGPKVARYTWHEVAQIDAYKIDLFSVDSVVLEFKLKSPSRVVQVSEECIDFQRLVDFLETAWPRISKDWRAKVFQPPFAECRTILFAIPS